MKTFTTSLLVNRLLTSLLTLAIFFVSGKAIASTDNNVYTVSIASGIEYASLTANATEKSVFINWVTASEQDNSHFEVERSSDMKVFKTVAIVLDGFAAEGTGKIYKFKEDAGDVRKGKTVYYRLKQIGNDNIVHYSAVMAVHMNAPVNIIPGQDAESLKSDNSFITPGVQKLLSTQATISTGINILAAGANKPSAGIFTGINLMSENKLNSTEPVFA